MMKTMKNRQHGLTISGFLMGSIVLVIVLVVGMKMVPAYIQDGEILDVFKAITNDPDMRTASIQDIRMSYIKRSSINDINAIKPDDVQIEQNGNGLTLSAKYQVKLPLVANVSLLLDFHPRSTSH